MKENRFVGGRAWSNDADSITAEITGGADRLRKPFESGPGFSEYPKKPCFMIWEKPESVSQADWRSRLANDGKPALGRNLFSLGLSVRQ
jgi:hypothetical protein